MIELTIDSTAFAITQFPYPSRGELPPLMLAGSRPIAKGANEPGPGSSQARPPELAIPWLAQRQMRMSTPRG